MLFSGGRAIAFAIHHLAPSPQLPHVRHWDGPLGHVPELVPDDRGIYGWQEWPLSQVLLDLAGGCRQVLAGPVPGHVLSHARGRRWQPLARGRSNGVRHADEDLPCVGGQLAQDGNTVC